MSASKHNHHCTCRECGGTGLSIAEQSRIFYGTFRHVPGPADKLAVAKAEAAQSLKQAERAGKW